jgi:hypothetical protein
VRLLIGFLFAAVSLRLSCAAQLEFAAYLQADGIDYFMLTDRDTGAKSDWLALGKTFRDQRLVSYDATRSALVVENAGTQETLIIRDAVTGDAGSGLQLVKTEFGWFAAKQKGRGTTDIPLELGITFGIEAVFTGVSPKATVEFETRVHTPPLRQPDGSVTTIKTSRQKIAANADGKLPTRTAYFSFEEPWQLVPGTYRTEIVYEGRVIASKAFNVMANAPRPPQPEDQFVPGVRTDPTR